MTAYEQLAVYADTWARRVYVTSGVANAQRTLLLLEQRMRDRRYSRRNRAAFLRLWLHLRDQIQLAGRSWTTETRPFL